jgi:hypothetical protein
MKRSLSVALILACVAPPAFAQGEDDEEEEVTDDEEEETVDEEAKPTPPPKKEEAEAEEEGEEEEEETDEDGLPEKQNLSGRDEGTDKKPTQFERDRFFVDKVDTEETENGTLVQGSIASSSFMYFERGGNYLSGPGGMQLSNVQNAGPSRLFTELRLQTDFRHIGGGKWDARIDARARAVNHPDNATYMAEGAAPGVTVASEPNRIQSGLYGENEYELRELWLYRSGKRSDIFFGRQYVPDLGGMKFDGLRVDYAKSSKLTLIGFGGLMPVRGSRSVTTDYLKLEDEKGNPAGRFVATGGFGGAYRTLSSYGALGAVAQVPLQKEQPRVYVTSNGYLRSGAKLDVYHYILVDLLGNAAQSASSRIQLTNLSGGLNFKPSQRLRLTASVNRVDTETLAVQAGAFLQQPDDAGGVGPILIQNEAYIQRIATNQARGGISAGLGKLNRFEISMAVAYRQRPEFTLSSPGAMGIAPILITMPAASSAEVWGSIVDRRSIANTRIGLEGFKTFAVSDLAYQRTIGTFGRLFVLREIAGGRGEWEAEAGYATTKNTVLGAAGTTGCGLDMGDPTATPPRPPTPLYVDCYGTSNNSLISLGGQLFYRLKTDWFGIGTLHVLRITNKRSDGVEDPTILGVTGFIRIAKRF